MPWFPRLHVGLQSFETDARRLERAVNMYCNTETAWHASTTGWSRCDQGPLTGKGDLRAPAYVFVSQRADV